MTELAHSPELNACGKKLYLGVEADCNLGEDCTHVALALAESPFNAHDLIFDSRQIDIGPGSWREIHGVMDGTDVLWLVRWLQCEDFETNTEEGDEEGDEEEDQEDNEKDNQEDDREEGLGDTAQNKSATGTKRKQDEGQEGESGDGRSRKRQRSDESARVGEDEQAQVRELPTWQNLSKYSSLAPPSSADTKECMLSFLRSIPAESKKGFCVCLRMETGTHLMALVRAPSLTQAYARAAAICGESGRLQDHPHDRPTGRVEWAALGHAQSRASQALLLERDGCRIWRGVKVAIKVESFRYWPSSKKLAHFVFIVAFVDFS